MPAVVHTLTPVVYVSDVDTALGFYRILGLVEVLRGGDGEWQWAYLRCGDVSALLAAGADAHPPQSVPVHMYCQTEDVVGLQERLVEGGFVVEHLGYPDHAPGGEIRVVDPDQHVVMLAQTTGAPRVDATDRPDTRTTILHRAAEAVRRRGGTGHHCQVGERGGARCPRPADVKLTDSWGDTAWSCLPHADEVIVGARGVYLATEDAEGLTTYLSRRRRRDVTAVSGAERLAENDADALR